MMETKNRQFTETRANFNLLRNSLIGLALLAVMVTAIEAKAAPIRACKSLDQSSCQELEQCSWVNSYVRKDGREVRAFCRTKAKRKQINESVQNSENKQSK